MNEKQSVIEKIKSYNLHSESSEKGKFISILCKTPHQWVRENGADNSCIIFASSSKSSLKVYIEESYGHLPADDANIFSYLYICNNLY